MRVTVQVTHPFYRKPGDLFCPCCEWPAVLQGNGIRQGTCCALSLVGHSGEGLQLRHGVQEVPG
jgi:hypothetical protein